MVLHNNKSTNREKHESSVMYTVYVHDVLKSKTV